MSNNIRREQLDLSHMYLGTKCRHDIFIYSEKSVFTFVSDAMNDKDIKKKKEKENR